MAVKDYRGAVEAYTRAIKLDPRVPDYHHNISVAYSMLGNSQLAEYHRRTYLVLQGQ
jgi:cytochrome c-type biogenesis protein CcmH/NrfG